MLYGNPMIPYFEEKKSVAAGICDDKGTYTAGLFKEDYPQFTDADGNFLIPSGMLSQFIEMANDSVSPGKWGTSYRYAAGLYVAHFSAVYLKPYKESSGSATEAASGADMVGVVKSATMGDTSVSYDNSAITAGAEKWGMWNSTQYGAQLVTLARQLGITGMYVV